jgi:hypothetical protein
MIPDPPARGDFPRPGGVIDHLVIKSGLKLCTGRVNMRVRLTWDDPQQTIVRWDFERFIDVINFIVPINEMTTLAMLNGGSADTIINMDFRLIFPNRGFSQLKKPILAARSYGLGYVAIVTANPLARAIIRLTLTHDPAIREAVCVMPSIAAARARLAQLRAERDLRMKM